MRRTFENVFIVGLILFLACGSLLVLGQFVGIIIQNGDLVLTSQQIFAKPAFILASFSGIIAYLLNFTNKKKAGESNTVESEIKISS